MNLITVSCPPCHQCSNSADTVTAYRDEQLKLVLIKADVLVTPGEAAPVQPIEDKPLSI